MVTKATTAVKNKMAKLLNMMVERLTKLESLKERLEQSEKTVVTLTERLGYAEKRLVALEARPIYYQPIPPLGAPWPNPVMPAPGSPYNPNPYPTYPGQTPFIYGENTCGKCGLLLGGNMSYCCSTFDCPMQARSTCTIKVEVLEGGQGYTTVGDMKVALSPGTAVSSVTSSTEAVTALSSNWYVDKGL